MSYDGVCGGRRMPKSVKLLKYVRNLARISNARQSRPDQARESRFGGHPRCKVLSERAKFGERAVDGFLVMTAVVGSPYAKVG